MFSRKVIGGVLLFNDGEGMLTSAIQWNMHEESAIVNKPQEAREVFRNEVEEQARRGGWAVPWYFDTEEDVREYAGEATSAFKAYFLTRWDDQEEVRNSIPLIQAAQKIVYLKSALINRRWRRSR